MQIRQGLDNSSIVLIVYYTNTYLKLNENITLDHGHEGEKILCIEGYLNYEAMVGTIRLWDMFIVQSKFPLFV